MSKSYIVRERADGTRYFDENTPTGQISPDTIGYGLKSDTDGKVVVDTDTLSSDFVKKTGDKMTGLLTTTSSVHMYNVNIKKGNHPSNGRSWNILGNDEDTFVGVPQNTFGRFTVGLETDGKSSVYMQAYQNVAGSSNYCRIGASIDENGVKTTDAPTPPLTDKSTQIATTAWVKNVLPNANGFKVNPDGTVSVDFSAMDTATINTIRKEMGVKIPLTAAKNFYVDVATGSDTIDEGRGESAAKPFKTIQACVNYITGFYDLVRFNANVNVAAGTYNEFLTFADYSQSGGVIRLLASGGRVSLKAERSASNLVAVSRGVYEFVGFDFEHITTTTASNAVTRAVYVHTYGNVHLYECSVKCTQKDTSISNIGSIHLVEANANGTLSFSRGCTFRVNAPGAAVYVFYGQNSGEFSVNYSNVASEVSYPTIVTASRAATFIYMTTYSKFSMNVSNRTNKPDFKTGSTFTGKRYDVRIGAFVGTNSGGTEFFPGTTAGTVDSATYALYVA